MTTMQEWLFDRNREGVPIFLIVRPSWFANNAQSVDVCMAVDFSSRELVPPHIKEVVYADPGRPFDPEPFEHALNNLYARIDRLGNLDMGPVFEEIRMP